MDGNVGSGSFDLPPEAVARRRALLAFLEEHAPGGAYPRDWNQRLARAGYVAPHWPRPWGLGADAAEQLAIEQVLVARSVPRPLNPIGIGWAGPTLLVAGTPAQQQRWLPGILDGSELWCQLFSEPDAGSDLASLRTRATLDGDELVVDGQKVWTTLAHVARWGILLARTEAGATRHAGITYLVVDMTVPGITVRPIHQMTGTHEFNEVLFEEVRVPLDHVVGDIGGGWRLAKVTLANERVSLSGGGALWGRGPSAHDLLDLVRTRGGISDPVARQRLAACYVQAEVLRLTKLRVISAKLRGLEPGPEASVGKALGDAHGQRVMFLAKDLAGAHGLCTDAGPFGTDAALWHYGFCYAPALTIGGGTAEVQRDILGERVLGLPRAPG